MGGSSSNRGDTQSNTYNTDNRNYELGDGSLVADHSNVEINTLDGGVIDRAFDFGSDALSVVSRNSANTNKTTSKMLSSVTNLAQSIKTGSNDNDKQNKLILMLGGGALVTAVVVTAIAKK